MNWDHHKNVMKEIAASVRKAVLPWFNNSELPVELKADETPVSLADREAEKAIRGVIHRHFPDDGIWGEEFGREEGTSGVSWILDPIDGTKAFIRGCPLFGTLVAVMAEGQPELGLIYNPVMDIYCLGDGRTTEINGKQVRVGSVSSISAAGVLCSEIGLVAQNKNPRGFEQLMKHCAFFRTWGDCYGYVFVARGAAHVMVDPIMNPWDLMALVPVIRGAGGIITDWEGGDVVKGSSAVAACPEIHAEVIRLLNS